MKKIIKILSPIDDINEVESLIKAGADEFYCGVLIGSFCSSSNRTVGERKENLSDLKNLEILVKRVKDGGKKVFLTINNQILKKNEIEKIFQKISYFKSIGVDGYIISSIDLLERLKDQDLKLIASSFLETKNIKRVILDRQITESDIKNIRQNFPEMEIETFIMEAGCRSLDSYCNRDIFNREQGIKAHTCMAKFYIEKNNKKITKKNIETILKRLKLPNPTCGICAIKKFKKYKVDSIKIVGRGFPLDRKIENIKFVKKAIDFVYSDSSDDYYEYMMEIFNKRYGFKCNKEFCYYPHFNK